VALATAGDNHLRTRNVGADVVRVTPDGTLRVPEVDDDQLAALRRLGVAFDPIEVIKIVGHDQVVSDDPEDDWLGGKGKLGEGGEDGRPAADDP
jgi:hypothetical protein